MQSQHTYPQSAIASRPRAKRASRAAEALPHPPTRQPAAGACCSIAKAAQFAAKVHCQSIGEKAVFISESQRAAFALWNQIRRAIGTAPRVLTFGFQSGTQPAFEHYAWFNPHILGCSLADTKERRRRAQHLINIVDTDDDESVVTAAARLRHAERLDAALRCGIIELAFVVAMRRNAPLQSNEQITLDFKNSQLTAQHLSEESGESMEGTLKAIDLPSVADPPYTYSIPENGIVEVPWHCEPNGFPCQRKMARAALEAPVLRGMLATIDDICCTGGVPGLFERPYVLDINLDFFSTHRAVSPQDTSLFYDLIRRSVGITIALESDFVYPEQVELHGVNGAKLLAKLERHIVKAMAM